MASENGRSKTEWRPLDAVNCTLILPSQYITPTAGNTYSLKCFVIAVFGGLGNIWGAVIAGLIIGVVESFTSLFLGCSWADMVIYLIFILTLIIKPTGLLGKKG